MEPEPRRRGILPAVRARLRLDMRTDVTLLSDIIIQFRRNNHLNMRYLKHD